MLEKRLRYWVKLSLFCAKKKKAKTIKIRQQLRYRSMVKIEPLSTCAIPNPRVSFPHRRRMQFLVKPTLS